VDHHITRSGKNKKEKEKTKTERPEVKSDEWTTKNGHILKSGGRKGWNTTLPGGVGCCSGRVCSNLKRRRGGKKRGRRGWTACFDGRIFWYSGEKKQTPWQNEWKKKANPGQAKAKHKKKWEWRCGSGPLRKTHR